MKNIEKIVEELHLDTELLNSDIPNIDLYMDQVIQLFENKFKDTKRNPDEKILTKTMINNYSKGKLFFPIKNKKYSRAHVMLINMIYEMKTVLSIRDIKHAVTNLNEEIMENDFQLENLYEKYLALRKENADQFLQDSMQMGEDISEKMKQFEVEGGEYFEKLMLSLSFVNMSNYYRRAAEKIIDQIENTETKKD